MDCVLLLCTSPILITLWDHNVCLDVTEDSDDDLSVSLVSLLCLTQSSSATRLLGCLLG